MSLLHINTKFSVMTVLKDPQVRAGMYTWLIIAGFCVIVANAMAHGL